MGGHNKLNLLGQNFGRLTVEQEIGRKQKSEVLWKCVCECGKETQATTSQLRSAKVKSCGCLRIDEGRKVGSSSVKHGMARDSGRSPTYRSWQAMKDRCENPTRKSYQWYGERGVTVCDRWAASFDNFLSDMGERPDGMTLDRINPFGNYEPSNCRWTDIVTQNNNTRKHYEAAHGCNN